LEGKVLDGILDLVNNRMDLAVAIRLEDQARLLLLQHPQYRLDLPHQQQLRFRSTLERQMPHRQLHLHLELPALAAPCLPFRLPTLVVSVEALVALCRRPLLLVVSAEALVPKPLQHQRQVALVHKGLLAALEHQ
jgi:hypothetical protein